MKAAVVPDWLDDSIAATGVSGLWVTEKDIGKMPIVRGAYVLALRLDEEVPVALPRSAAGRLVPGWYLYMGSARGSGGVRARVRRHFRQTKKLHWHIDRLTAVSAEMAALSVAGGNECELLGKLLEHPRFGVAVPGFGNTDCRRCASHLLAAAPS